MDDQVLIATPMAVLRVNAADGSSLVGAGLEGQKPTGLAADPWIPGRAWCSTDRGGVFRTDDAGASWNPCGPDGERLMTVAAAPARAGLVWAGAEPSVVWRSDDAGATWRRTAHLETLPSSGTWAFPPRPDTHHVRWIAADPTDPGRLCVAVEAGALVRTVDGGRTWIDRVAGGPYDTHELAIHPDAPDVLRSAAGDGYFESRDAGESWSSPMDGLEVRYLRSVAIDPGDHETVLVSAASGPRTAYVAGRSDGRVYRRVGDARWDRVTSAWPDPARGIAPLLTPGLRPAEIWAADERGLHHSADGGVRFTPVFRFTSPPDHLRGVAVLAPAGERSS